MTHSESTLKTKNMLATALHKTLESKSFDRITISEMIESCGINRKTFYYHFQDMFDLLSWMMNQEAISVFKEINLPYDYNIAIEFVMDYIDDNTDMLKNVIYSSGREEIHRFFLNSFLGIADSIIKSVEELIGKNIDDTYREYLCQFYCNAVAGMMIYWIENGEGRDREYAKNTIADIITKSLVEILSKYKNLAESSNSFPIE